MLGAYVCYRPDLGYVQVPTEQYSYRPFLSGSFSTSKCYVLKKHKISFLPDQIWVVSRYPQNNTLTAPFPRVLFLPLFVYVHVMNGRLQIFSCFLCGSKWNLCVRFSLTLTSKCYVLKKHKISFLPDQIWAMSRYPQNNTLTAPFSRVLFLPANVMF